MKFCAVKDFCGWADKMEPQTRLALWRRYFKLPVKIHMLSHPTNDSRFYFVRKGRYYLAENLQQAIELLTLLLVNENREISQ